MDRRCEGEDEVARRLHRNVPVEDEGLSLRDALSGDELLRPLEGEAHLGLAVRHDARPLLLLARQLTDPPAKEPAEAVEATPEFTG